MEITNVPADCWKITDAKGLDPIHVFWIDSGPGQGYVTIICYGEAWSAYFGGMGDRTIKEFFAAADTGYMVSKMGITRSLKSGKKYDTYLGRVIEAVREAVKEHA